MSFVERFISFKLNTGALTAESDLRRKCAINSDAMQLCRSVTISNKLFLIL